MSITKSLQVEFKISTEVHYIAGESRPDQSYFFFSYKISIENKGNSPAQLMSRHWQITNGLGQVEEVRGPGVVGLQPKIYPGQKFEYESACPLETPWGIMRGQYQFLAENGETFAVDIPEFYLISPQAMH
ncbi:MAG: Co2+/Mg2+ efflux protein ApaG [Bdellovibrionia bacterium]